MTSMMAFIRASKKKSVKEYQPYEVSHCSVNVEGNIGDMFDEFKVSADASVCSMHQSVLTTCDQS